MYSSLSYFTRHTLYYLNDEVDNMFETRMGIELELVLYAGTDWARE